MAEQLGRYSLLYQRRGKGRWRGEHEWILCFDIFTKKCGNCLAPANLSQSNLNSPRLQMPREPEPEGWWIFQRECRTCSHGELRGWRQGPKGRAEVSKIVSFVPYISQHLSLCVKSSTCQKNRGTRKRIWSMLSTRAQGLQDGGQRTRPGSSLSSFSVLSQLASL